RFFSLRISAMGRMWYYYLTSPGTSLVDKRTSPLQNISMDQNQINQSGTVPNGSEDFGNVPNNSESFRTVPKGSERFGTIQNAAERKDNHTLTVRETARMFEVAGVARTERSIVNWCQLNKLGVVRLDAYFDPN